MEKYIYDSYLEILKEELVPAMGCTEPVAVAYAGALARKTLGSLPKKAELSVSGNIIKNVKSVIVPETGGRRGLKTALCTGILFGDAEKKLEVIAFIKEDIAEELDKYMMNTDITVSRSSSSSAFDICVTVYDGDESACVHIEDGHTNVTSVKKNDKVLFERGGSEKTAEKKTDRTLLSIEKITEFAETVDLSDIRDMLSRQIEYNMAIAQEGIGGGYGAEIGKIILSSYGSSINNRAKAYAAAGSDARMNGCEMPVVINSGSGNQGITASVPVIVYAKELGVSEEKLLRALTVSNLVTIHLKTGIGCLSAYCGATSAGAGAGAGICYLFGGRFDEIAHTVVNALAINSGMICDGAKASCAAKIASAVEAGLLGFQMYKHKSEFLGGDGIIVKGVENTIKAVSHVASEGMKRTDEEIIKLMVEND